MAFDRLRSLFGGGRNYYFNFSPTVGPSVEGLSLRELYTTQANLHAVVSFLADSVAQLPLKVYRRNGETDRERDRDSAAARTLFKPNDDQTAYEFWRAEEIERQIYGVSTIWRLPDAYSETGWQLRLIPAEWIVESVGGTNYAPDRLIIQAGSERYVEIDRSDFVQFRDYAPGNPYGYMSPIASLRQTLIEQVNADRFRSEVWRSSGRFNAYITRPKDVQPWDDETRKRFATEFRQAWSAGGGKAGSMPILEDGMEIKPYQFNAQQAQYAETKQLSREDVAAAYHINPSLIWHSTTQTYASAKDNARALYADCLGPVLQMLQQRINSFLLPMLGADDDTYVVFDLTEKLKGSFEERASILQSAVGAPWMTRNEARADNDLPPVDGGDDLIIPLNVLTGGQASPQDSEADPYSYDGIDNQNKAAEPQTKTAKTKVGGRAEQAEVDRLEEAFKDFFKRQAASILPRLGAGAEDWFNEKRWDKELAEDIQPIFQDIANTHGKATAESIGYDYSEEVTEAYIEAMAKGRAHAVNTVTKQKLEKAADDDSDEAPADVMEKRTDVEAPMIGRSFATAVASWATMESVHQAEWQGLPESAAVKVWVTGENARENHAAMNGVAVGVDDDFTLPNGERCHWPGDDDLSAEESCNCNCSVEIEVTT